MKAFLFFFIFIFCINHSNAQSNQVNKLPFGKYETIHKSSQKKWDRGDIILIDENKYKVTSSKEEGDYKFSVTAQRVFFTSGPLKSLYAKTYLNNNNPAIVLPVAENQQLGLKLPSEIWGYYKH